MGAIETIVTLSASPGSAPSTYTGPVTGLTLSKARASRSAATDRGESWPPEASAVSKATVSPGATVSAGGSALSQPKWWRWRWSVWAAAVMAVPPPVPGAP